MSKLVLLLPAASCCFLLLPAAYRGLLTSAQLTTILTAATGARILSQQGAALGSDAALVAALGDELAGLNLNQDDEARQKVQCVPCNACACGAMCHAVWHAMCREMCRVCVRRVLVCPQHAHVPSMLM